MPQDFITITFRATFNTKRYFSVQKVNNAVARCLLWDATGKVAFDGANEKHTNVEKRGGGEKPQKASERVLGNWHASSLQEI